MERRFAAAFAGYNDVEFCVPTTNGTASLMVALEACGVGAGDEVITPALSWVASASSILAINAVPILTDVDEQTLCMDPALVEASITPESRAIVVVHLYSAVAEIAALVEIAHRHGLALIEDCSQAHGAMYMGRKVGSFGDAGTFSMHETKALSCGEGGAAITKNANVAQQMLRLRADGRDYRNYGAEANVSPGGAVWSLVESGQPMGSNFAMSEIHAAILIEQLKELDAQIALRGAGFDFLAQQLRTFDIDVQATSPGTTRRSPFGLPVRLPAKRADADPALIADKLWHELRVPCRRPYSAMGKNCLYNPTSRKRFGISPDFMARIQSGMQRPTPVANGIGANTIVFPHQVLLADFESLERLANALGRAVNSS